jgi:hypothetical protein
MRRISAAVFDLGGVLIDWDPRHLNARCSGRTRPRWRDFSRPSARRVVPVAVDRFPCLSLFEGIVVPGSEGVASAAELRSRLLEIDVLP